LQAVIFDEIDLSDVSFAECSVKNANHSFQVRQTLKNPVYVCPFQHAIRKLIGLLVFARGCGINTCGLFRFRIIPSSSEINQKIVREMGKV
jgi:hypothetical protein